MRKSITISIFVILLFIPFFIQAAEFQVKVCVSFDFEEQWPRPFLLYSDQLYGLGPMNSSKIAGNNTKIPPQ